jgi:hypothetical protein
VVKLGLLLRPDPNDRQPFKMNLIGEFYGPFWGHLWNVGDEAFCHMLKGIKVIVEHDDFVIWVRYPRGLTAFFNFGCRNGTGLCDRASHTQQHTNKNGIGLRCRFFAGCDRPEEMSHPHLSLTRILSPIEPQSRPLVYPARSNPARAVGQSKTAPPQLCQPQSAPLGQ